VVTVEDNGDLLAVAPLAMSKLKVMGLSLRTVALAGGVPHSLRLVTNSIMFSTEREGALENMVTGMRKLDWSILWTQNMDSTGPMDRYISAVSSVWHTTVQVPNTNLTVPIPESGEVSQDFDKHARKTLGKALRMIEREGHQMAFRKVSSEDVDRAVEIYAQQHRERWVTRGGSSFQNPRNVEFLKRATLVAYQQGFGLAYELLIDGEVIGQVFGFRDRSRAYMYRLGMSNAHMKFSPGWLIWHHVLQDIRKQGITSCVLGGGEEQYKYEMGGLQSPLVGVQATRGVASFTTMVMESRPVQRLDSKLGLTKRAVGMLSVERDAEHTPA
jgi:CelD/BcsL family acetyltransferase involved in cellulose biosynthesis